MRFSTLFKAPPWSFADRDPGRDTKDFAAGFRNG
jgi:hypothetical protein